MLVLVTLFLGSVLAQNCPIQPQTTIYEQPVSISTEVLQNGTITPIPGHPLAITNAPTSINTLTTLTWTTNYTSGFPTAGSPSPPDVSNAALIAGSTFYLIAVPRLGIGKRQAGFSYVGTNGNTIGNCADAPTYSLINGQLYAFQHGTTYQYSATPGTAYAPFIPTTSPGPITTQFGFAVGSILSWTNVQFFNGAASFCSKSDGTVYAVFQEAQQPQGCFYVALTLYSQSSCQAAVAQSASALTATVDKYTSSYMPLC